MEIIINQKFEEIKKSIPELTMFLKDMPKGGDLHDHSLGSSYSEFIYEDAIRLNDWYDLKNNMFLTNEEYENSDKNESIISIESFKNSYADNMFNHFSMKGWDGVKDGANHFFSTFLSTISSKRSENSMILEIIKRNKLQNVTYLELLAEAIPENVKEVYVNSLYEKNSFTKEDMKKYCEILDSLDNEENLRDVKGFLDEREDYLKENGAGDFPIRYITFLTRASSPLYKFFAEAYCFMLYSLKEKRIAGTNIVEPEDSVPSRINYEKHLEIIRFIYDYLTKKHNLEKDEINLTLHAGELNLLRSPLEDINDRICSTIFLSKEKDMQKFPYTKRIGHGVSIPWEENARDLLNYMSKNHIPVEICLSSNEYILGIDGKHHPFPLYRKYNVPVVICTDDEAVNRSNLTNEYLKAVNNFNLSYSDLKNVSRNAIEFSFLEGESLFIDSSYENIRDEFKNLNTLEEWEDALEKNDILINSNPKLKAQIELEMNFIKFEKSYM